jgi:AcrR family transcriptional regulator
MNSAKRPRGRPVDAAARAERTAAILMAARRCFVRKGFHGASIADIASEAEVSVASLYQYFSSKEDLILAMTEWDLRQNLALIGKMAEPGSFRVQIATILDMVAEEARQPDALALQLEIAAEALRNPRIADALRRADQALLVRLKDAISSAQSRAEIDSSFEPEGLAAILLMMAEGLFSHVALGVGSAEPPKRALLHLLDR